MDHDCRARFATPPNSWWSNHDLAAGVTRSSPPCIQKRSQDALQWGVFTFLARDEALQKFGTFFLIRLHCSLEKGLSIGCAYATEIQSCWPKY